MATAIEPTLPTLYEYYTANGITSGLSDNQTYFTLNEKNIALYSGAMHYFRVPREYWRDRLRKMRAAGLNAVETYIPWNLHEPENGRFDFGSGNSDMKDFLHIEEFLKTAQEEDLLVLVRPGPYICAEWEFGGFPSWLLRQKDIKFRTSDSTYMKFVARYFNMLLPILAALQFTKGGPIVAFQVENEYGSTFRKGKFIPDRLYLEQLRELFLRNGIVELLYTSDGTSGFLARGTLPGVLLQTSNFKSNPEKEFNVLKTLQKNKPTMAMEFWTGWFDHWSEHHNVRNDSEFADVYERILQYPASVNMYMFIGGTSWGFLNGANVGSSATDNSNFQPDTTSYDYDSPLSENGDYTNKYVLVKELLNRYNMIKTRIPETPAITPRKRYENLLVTSQLHLNEILNQIPIKVRNPVTLPMELLPINNHSGQSYGYLVYRKSDLVIPRNSTLTIAGHVCDTVTVLVNGKMISKPLTMIKDLNAFGFWKLNNSAINLGPTFQEGTLELLVENWGRVGYGSLDQYYQYKGLWQGGIYLNDQELLDWEMVPLEFKKVWTNGLKGWHEVVIPSRGPAMYKADFVVHQDIQDTFLNMEDWTKGIVIVNGFVLGRYAQIGPQQTLYLPAPFIRKGVNEIIIFEHYLPSTIVKFSHKHIYKTKKC